MDSSRRWFLKTDFGNRHLELYLDSKLRENNEKINMEAYSKPYQTSETAVHVNMVQSWKLLTFFMKISMLGVWPYLKCVSEICNEVMGKMEKLS